MKELVNNIRVVFLNREFFKFLIVGVINTLNGILFSFMYSLYIDTNLAFIAGYITSLGIGYILNSLYIFYQKISWKCFLKFAISYIPNFIIQNMIVIILYNILHCPKLFAFGLAAIIGIPITFICVKFFAFKKI